MLRTQTGSWSLMLALGAGLFVASSGCSRSSAGSATPQPLEVRVVPAVQKDVPIYKEWIGTLNGLVNADIKAEVSGYLVEQAYKEGTYVKKGQLLFQIDPRPFQAALDQARGQLAQSQGQLEQSHAQLSQAEAQVLVAEANQRRTQLDVDKYTPLAKQQAVSEQDLDNATQYNLQAKAQVVAARAQVETARAQITATEAAVQSAKAAVETAQINLGFTHLTSPIDGIPGIAVLQVGALVSPASPAITTVSTLDPIKVYFTVSEQEYLDFSRQFATPELREADLRQLNFELILADGTTYPRTGKFDFTDRQVDVRTGDILIAALFPNPGDLLRPGQYGKIRRARIQRGAVLIPQEAVMELQGTRLVAVVGGSNKVNVHPVLLGDTVGHEWIVREGVKPGERVVVEGLQKVRQGMQVDPKPFVAR
jgi:RND family efflux transporter MFP subunit